MMLRMSPSGALSPYHYKGGYFHGIHYGSYFDNKAELLSMMKAEEEYILKSPEQKRVMIDFYETNITPDILEHFVEHIQRLSPRIIKLSISTDKKVLRVIRRALFKGCSLGKGQMYFTPDMEEGKTWLVSDKYTPYW